MRERRRDKASTILLTGTGFIGSHCGGINTCRGATGKFYRSWPTKQQSARVRMDQVFRWLGLDLRKAPQLQVIEACLDRPDFGLDKGLYDFVGRPN